MNARTSLGLLAIGVCTLVGCGPKAVRGSDVAGLDTDAMSTGLDKRDLEKLLHENLDALQKSPAIQKWSTPDASGNKPAVAVIPLRNETSEHVEGSLDALISDVETRLVGAGVRVISMEQQPKLVEEIRRQYAGGFQQGQSATWGKQVGAQYIVTGKVFSSDERQSDERRVQYFMFIQVLSVETGEILFQNKTGVTKAIL